MLKSNSLIPVCILLIITLIACSDIQKPLPVMTCKIKRITDECSPVPVLADGQLNIKKQRQFELTGLYEACYHQETVAIQGQYHSTMKNNVLTIELLSNRIKGIKSSKFPTTIAVVTMNNKTLEGNIRDIWPHIRSPQQNDTAYMAKITCKTHQQ